MLYGIAYLIDALSSPDIYSDRPSRVSMRQTHIPWLFFTERFVYKVKKPVDFGYLDFTTLEARKFCCDEEVRLNRRLTRLVAALHARAETVGAIDQVGTVATVLTNWQESFEQTRPYLGFPLPREAYDKIRGRVLAFCRVGEALFGQRIAEGRIRDGHGDLRAEHICLTEPIALFDCIEFNRRFRHGGLGRPIHLRDCLLDVPSVFQGEATGERNPRLGDVWALEQRPGLAHISGTAAVAATGGGLGMGAGAVGRLAVVGGNGVCAQHVGSGQGEVRCRA
jgi:hypothetical protein